VAQGVSPEFKFQYHKKKKKSVPVSCIPTPQSKKPAFLHMCSCFQWLM
jgi:hypothetical protein